MPFPKGAVGVVVDPKTHQRVLVYPKRKESAADAIKRVKAKHGISDAKGGEAENSSPTSPKAE